MPSRVVTIPDAGQHDEWDPDGLVPAVQFDADGQFVRGYHFLKDVSRDKASTDREYYVSMAGDDDNTGRSLAQAWRTLQGAADYLARNVDFNSRFIKVNVGAGDFAGVYNQGYVGGGVLYWKGAGHGATAADTILRNAVNPGGFTIGSFNLLRRTNTEIGVNKFNLFPTGGPALDCDQASAGDGIIVMGDLENFTDGFLTLSGCQNNGFILLGNLFDVANEIVINVPTLPANVRGYLNGLTKSAPFLSSTLRVQGGSLTCTIAFYVVNAETLCQHFHTLVGTVIGPKYLVSKGQLFGDTMAGFPGSLEGTVLDNGEVIYTGSDGVFGGTTQKDDHSINSTGGATSISNEQTNKHFTNEDATALATYTLPLINRDLEYTFINSSSHGMRIDTSGVTKIRIDGSPSEGDQIDTVQPGSAVTLRATVGPTSSRWTAKYQTGLWLAS